MQIFPLDPFQSEILDNILSGKNIYAKGGLDSGKAYTIANIFVYHILSGKSAVLIVDKDQDVTKFKQLFTKFKLINQCLFINDESFDHIDLARIKANYDFDSVPEYSAGFEILKNKIDFSKGEIIRSYESFNRKIFGDLNVSQVLDLIDNFNHGYGSDFLNTYLNSNGFELTEIEFTELKNVIERCKKVFRKEYLEFELNNLFSSNIFNQKFDEKNIQLIRNQFKSMYLELQKLRNAYIKYFATFKEKQKIKRGKQFIKLNRLKKELQYKIQEIEFIGKIRDDQKHTHFPLNMSIPFTKEKNLLASKYEELQKVFTEFRSSLKKFDLFEGYPELSKKDAPAVPTIRDYIESQNENFKNWKQIITDDVEESLKRLNTLNAEDLQLDNLELKLDKLIAKINAHHLFEEKFENNALSSFKKFQFLEYLIQQIEFAFFQLQKLPGYYGWQNFWQSLNIQAKNIITHLVKIDRKLWLNSFKSWYLRKVVENYHHPDDPFSNEFFRQYFKLIDDFSDSIENQIQRAWVQRRKNAYEKLISSDKALFNSIFKKNVEINWTRQMMLIKQPDLLINAFPIIIVKKSDILNLCVPLKKKWDLALSYEVTLVNKTEVRNLSQPGNIYGHFSKLELTNEWKQNFKSVFKGRKEIKSFGLPILHTSNRERLDKQSLRQKLKLAMKLASMITYAKDNIRVFHLKNAYCISALSNDTNKKLLEHFSKYGIKESKMKGEIKAGIVEVLLDTDKPTILFIRNGLINTEKAENFHWQKSVLHQFKQAGIIEFNIWSVEQINRPHTMFDRMEVFMNRLKHLENNAIAI